MSKASDLIHAALGEAIEREKKLHAQMKALERRLESKRKAWKTAETEMNALAADLRLLERRTHLTVVKTESEP